MRGLLNRHHPLIPLEGKAGAELRQRGVEEKPGLVCNAYLASDFKHMNENSVSR